MILRALLILHPSLPVLGSGWAEFYSYLSSHTPGSQGTGLGMEVLRNGLLIEHCSLSENSCVEINQLECL